MTWWREGLAWRGSIHQSHVLTSQTVFRSGASDATFPDVNDKTTIIAQPSMIRNASAYAIRGASRAFSWGRWPQSSRWSRNFFKAHRASVNRQPHVRSSTQHLGRNAQRGFHVAAPAKDETIYALSTGAGGAIAIVRISGPACDQVTLNSHLIEPMAKCLPDLLRSVPRPSPPQSPKCSSQDSR